MSVANSSATTHSVHRNNKDIITTHSARRTLRDPVPSGHRSDTTTVHSAHRKPSFTGMNNVNKATKFPTTEGSSGRKSTMSVANSSATTHSVHRNNKDIITVPSGHRSDTTVPSGHRRPSSTTMSVTNGSATTTTRGSSDLKSKPSKDNSNQTQAKKVSKATPLVNTSLEQTKRTERGVFKTNTHPGRGIKHTDRNNITNKQP